MLIFNFHFASYSYRANTLLVSVFISSVILFSCKTQERRSNGVDITSASINLQVGDSVLVAIDTYPKNVDSIVAAYTNLLGLHKIKSDSDLVNLRIWCELNDTVKILSLEMNGAESDADFYSFGFRRTNGKDFLCLYDKKEKIQPISGWSSFIDSTIVYRVIDMPEQAEVILNRKVFVEGGDVFTFEISNKGKTRSFRYVQPGAYRNDNWQSKYIYFFLKLIEREFRVSAHSSRLS